MSYAVLRTCTEFEAAEIQARLEAENIPVALIKHTESFVATVAGGMAEVDVCVRQEDRQRALEALETGLEYTPADRRLVRAQYLRQNYPRQVAPADAAPPTMPPAAHLRRALTGLAWLAGGVALTWLTLQSGSNLRVFFVGAILYGLYQLIDGLVNWWRSRS